MENDTCQADARHARECFRNGYCIVDPFASLFPGGRDYAIGKDDDGIVTIDYRRDGIGVQYNPVASAFWAISSFEEAMSGAEGRSGRELVLHADWLLDSLVEREGGGGAWEYGFDWFAPGYACHAPWISAMAQGVGISALLRAYVWTGDTKYLCGCSRAVTPFARGVESGGVVRRDGGDVWYDEYAGIRSVNVFNGFLFALAGLAELRDFKLVADADGLLEVGLATVRSHLKAFELNLGFFRSSRYDSGYLIWAGDKYHHCHVSQLRWFEEVTKWQVFGDVSRRWAGFERRYGPNSKSLGRLLFRIAYVGYARTVLRGYTLRMRQRYPSLNRP